MARKFQHSYEVCTCKHVTLGELIYTIKERNRFFDLSIPSFISAVESKDKFWLENPIGNKPMSYNLPLYKIENRCDNLKKWQEAEEKTLKNPLIFVKK